jgi:prepilin-type N-terminal cleavage/methylation domain-containing protein
MDACYGAGSLAVDSPVMGGLFVAGRRRREAGEVAVTATRGQRGFTLLELLITLSVTTIGLVGLLALHQSVVRGNDGASRSAEAQQFSTSEIEALRAMRPGDMLRALTGSPTIPASAQTLSRPVLGRGGVPYTITTTVAPLPAASASLMRVRVVTSWAEAGGTLGSNGGKLDHALALELIRTLEEAP